MKEHTTKDWRDFTVYPKAKRFTERYGQRDESLGSMLIRRNKYLIQMFSGSGHRVALFGSAENPVIVIDRLIRLSAYVYNFKLHIKKTPEGDEVYKTLTINYTNRISHEDIEDFLGETITKVFRIKEFDLEL